MTNSAAPIGILGDGQLALMLGESARSHHLPFLSFGESTDSSFARAFSENFILGDTRQIETLISFAKQCSVVTLENEFLSAATLEEIERRSGTRVIPSPKSYRHFETKIAQRRFYQTLQIPSPKWASAASTPDKILTQIETDFSYPVVLKANQGGYDGYGVRIVRSREEIPQALFDLKHSDTRPVLIEEKVAITREFAQGALFDGKGNAIYLPLVETIQRNGICELVVSKSTLPEKEFLFLEGKIKTALTQISKSGIVGLYSFEFFLTQSGEVLINEGAPRPHNSQHLGLNASPVSQFDLLVRFLAEGKLPDVESPVPSKPGVMINLLGKSNSENYELTLPAMPADLEIYPKLYLKKESRIGRKMGHLNLIDPSGTHDLIALAETLLKEYTL
jgi:5-(carboxyamino)imidazole ribonucleotide synthase